MGFQATRLRRGEILAAVAAIVLLIDLFAVAWYTDGRGMTVSITGWEALSVLRWLILATGLIALALAWFQATRRAPALPVSLSTIATVLGTITTLALIWRVLLDAPARAGGVSAAGGAYVGLGAALTLAIGALGSLREEDPPDPAQNEAIPIVPIP